MLTTVAVSGYRSLREVVVPLHGLDVVTGANGSGKSSLYRALRLLADAAQGRIVASLAREGGLSSTLWAGPETLSAAMKRGDVPFQARRRKEPISLRLGFSSENYGYAIDLGLPEPTGSLFGRDPEIKTESVWLGERLSRSGLVAERRGPSVRLRDRRTGEWRQAHTELASFDSMMTQCADPEHGHELLLLRERMRGWRFYDHFRVDQLAPARLPQVGTFTPILSGDGSDLAAAIQTIVEIGDDLALEDSVADAFGGARVVVDGDFELRMEQPGLLRPLRAAELSDGTLRYLLLVAALLSPRPPELMILNEPEASLHPSLLGALARLLSKAARSCQIILVSHSERLVEALCEEEDVRRILLEKAFGETKVSDEDGPRWVWPSR